MSENKYLNQIPCQSLKKNRITDPQYFGSKRERERVIFLNNEEIFADIGLKFGVNKNSDSMTLKLYSIKI